MLDSHTEPVDNGESYTLPDYVPREVTQIGSCVRGGYTRNGLYHVFGGGGNSAHSAIDWNSAPWKTFAGLKPSDWVFAECIAGVQYFWRQAEDSAVYGYSPLHGTIDRYAQTTKRYCYGYLQDKYGVSQDYAPTVEPFRIGRELPRYKHIAPKIPPVLGGAMYKSGDYELWDSRVHISIMAQLHSQLKQVEPGIVVRSYHYDDRTDTLELLFA